MRSVGAVLLGPSPAGPTLQDAIGYPSWDEYFQGI